MKANLLLVALTIFSFASLTRSFADSDASVAGIDELSSLGVPLGQFSIIRSVTMGGDIACDVNAFALEADQDASAIFETLVISSAPVNLLRMTFNNGLNTVSDWKIESSEANHESKALGLFRVPEPTTIALFFAGVGTLLLFRRRQRLA
ncbi:MAG: hypothetical protein BGO12_13360 [Verrucomicrobia bacterium 61-8]|nr:PEP-CTERM sorting domain-containing protein [Verrucomicrobiota bacterium]OJU98245.1 MAG: hypothetical protein BGO12_13360 [Verrucomicrobia bacterium 61-8]